MQALASESVPIIITRVGDEKLVDEYPSLTRYIDGHYTIVGRTNFETPNREGDYTVNVRNDRAPARMHSATALPCFN